MKKILLVGSIVFAAACGGKADNALKELEGFKDKMCACKDASCADGVEKEMMEWAKKMKDEVKEEDISDEQKAKGKEISKAMRECRRAARKSAEAAPATP